HLAGPLARGAGGTPPIQVGALLNQALLPLALLGLLDRFRTAGPLVRQQTKWLLAAAALSVGVSLATIPLRGSAAAQFVGLLVGPLPAVATAVAVFRYRLW